MATTFADLLSARDAARIQTNPCSCPVCTGLDCLQHPRFFAGQVISETDLNGEIEYILAKQRLHNRYLHGAGTVCGLEVVCNDCDGYVTVKPGYAISPCGDDIIVCQEQAFNVIKAINDCCSSRKKKSVCDPYQPATDPGCAGLEQHWCITIRYRETPTQAVTPLRAPQKACPCCGGCGNSCNCGGSQQGGNGNGNGTKKGSACGCGASSSAGTTTASTPAPCEPTRVLEGYELGIVPDPNCRDPKNLLNNTLFANLLDCYNELTGVATKIPANSAQIVGLAMAGSLPNSQTADSDAYMACCQVRQYVLEILSNSGSITHCASVKVFEAASCPTPPANEDPGTSTPEYLSTVQTSIQLTVKALVGASLECFCHDLLPPCSSDPTDDRLILACLTVKDGEIVDICNFACRRFAGAFPSFFYWLSVIPIVPLIRRFVEDLCCGRVESRKVPGREVAVAAPAQDVANLQRTMMESNFALPRMFLDQIGDFAQKFSVSGLAASFPTGELNLATLRGMSIDDAAQALKTYGVSYETQAVNTRAEIPLSIRAFAPFAKQGDHVVLYQSGNTVLEVHPVAAAAAAQPTADMRSEVESLRSEIDKLKKSVASLRKKQ